MTLPDFLQKALREQYGDLADRIIAGYSAERRVTLRANRLKTSPEEVMNELTERGISATSPPWSADAFIVDAKEETLRALPMYQNGEIYLQSLSSMIPPMVLEPRAGDAILDMAAAPGGKTTQMAALSGGRANITACEKNKVRAERLKFNLARQGASRVSVMVCDSRRLDDRFTFDKVLLDAPCSGSGTITPERCDFTEELYARSQRFQAELLGKALRLLRSGSRMVYSTCSVLAGENEEVLKRVLPRAGARILPISQSAFEGAPRLPVQLDGTLCICPNELYEGFFVALIEKI